MHIQTLQLLDKARHSLALAIGDDSINPEQMPGLIMAEATLAQAIRSQTLGQRYAVIECGDDAQRRIIYQSDVAGVSGLQCDILGEHLTWERAVRRFDDR